MVYFAAVFAVGFALGAIRTVIVAPRMGETTAVLVELPIILVVSWAACRQIVALLSVPAGQLPRSVMGGVAFVLLIAAEFVLGIGLGRSLAATAAAYATVGGMLGLAGQVAFGLFPLVQRARRHPPGRAGVADSPTLHGHVPDRDQSAAGIRGGGGAAEP
jgi:hypothetical protein